MHNINLPSRGLLRTIYEQYFSARVSIARDIEIAIDEALSLLCSHPTVKGRVKEFESYYKKYIKLLKGDPAPPLITDIIGIRIVCPFCEDLFIVENILKKNFTVTEVERKGSHYSFKEFGYESIHLLIKIPETMIQSRGDCGLEVVEIQIRTILQDAWAEVEHELVYKAEFTPFDEPMKRKLAAVNASLSLADTIFQEIRTYQRQLNDQLGKRRDSFFKKVEESTDDLLFSPKILGSPGLQAVLSGETADNSLDVRNTSIDDLLLKALYAHNKNQFGQAIDLYTRILSMTPDNTIGSLIYKHRGMANFAQSQYGAAIMDFTQSLELHQSYQAAYYRGVVKAVLQQYADAIDDFTLSLNLNPYQAFCLYRRGQAYYHIDDLPQALADCEAALLLEPDSKSLGRFKDMLLTKLKL